MSAHNLCFIVPVYNHHSFIEKTLDQILPYGHDVFLVDDGSSQACNILLEKLAQEHGAVHLIVLPYNQGKGSAVIAGFQAAFKQGFTHALQIDADGQHNVDDSPLFIKRSRAYPNEVVSGRPVYDESLPKARLYGRYITHFWVWVETLSFDIKDSMCGFRVYPLAAVNNLLKTTTIKRRMDFDTDILVRLYWQDVPMHFIETTVIYPDDGISHFDMVSDNWRITKMHTTLFFGMLKRLPYLLLKRFSS